jgi:flagellar protein FliS
VTYAKNPLARYSAVNFSTSSPAQITVMLYDGLFRFLREAMAALEAGDRARAGERIHRAHAILKHLLGSMVPEANPTLHERLTSLYLFAMRHCTQANLQKSPEMLAEVIRVLLPLRGAWSTVAERGRTSEAAAAATTVSFAQTG